MNNPLGSLPNAPLAFVLAQIRLLLLPPFDLDRVSSAMHTELFQCFPRKQKVDSQKLVMGPDGEPHLESGESIISLSSLDQKEDVLISSNFVAFQATKYVDYPDFKSRLDLVVRSMFANLGPLAVQQVGLRYIDFVYPRPSDVLEDYLPAAATKVDIPGKIAETSMQVTDIQFPSARAIVRVTRGKGKAMLPADLGPVLNLAPSSIMEKDPGQVETAILDIDGIASHNMQDLKDSESVLSVFDTLHHDITGSIFREMTTSHAMNYWKQLS
jgi:uncharacterized protein (TIGR04255 family)